MTAESEVNKDYWNERAPQYSDVWKGKVKEALSLKEEKFIVEKLKQTSGSRILDIGIGHGRILHSLLRYCRADTSVFGVDVSLRMVQMCQDRFQAVANLHTLSVCDLSEQDLPFGGTFDFITAIRVLKYNLRWKEMVKKMCDRLAPGGTLIFTMPNKHSISFFHKDTFSEKCIPFQYTSVSELRRVLEAIGFVVSEVQGFSRVPEPLYRCARTSVRVRTVLWLELVCSKMLGRYTGSRILFIVCHKR